MSFRRLEVGGITYTSINYKDFSPAAGELEMTKKI